MKMKLIELSIANQTSIKLTKSKLLVGCSENCDVKISHDQLSHYHALIEIDEQQNIHVTDLNSIHGTYLNGQIITEKSFAIKGDTISFGSLHCEILQTQDKYPFEYIDKKSREAKTDTAIFVPKAVSEDAILIDDEYCDVLFKEIEETTDVSLNADFSNYIEPESFIETFPIIKENDSLSVLVTTSVNDCIIEQKYFPFSEQVIFATNTKSSKNSIVIDVLTKPKTSLFEIRNNTLNVFEIDTFSSNKPSMTTENQDRLILQSGDYRVFIEFSQSPANLEKTPWFFREKGFLKDSSKVFACFLPFLFLLLVDISIEKDPEPVSIVYKVRTSTKKSAKNETKAGAKALKQEAIKKVVKSPKKKTTKRAPLKKVVAKTKPAKKAPIKAYEFKMKSNLSNMFKDTKAAAVESKNSPSRSIASVNNSSLTKSLNKRGTGSGQALKGIGSGLANAKNDFGANGLSNKDGMDSSFIETQTVVMGSIDPELLRKILQEYLPQFRHCYQQELSYNSEDIKGIVDLNFEISSKGSVQRIKVSAKDARFSKKGTDCMGTVLGIINFPKPKGGGRVSVRQPLNFFAQSEKS